MAFKCYCIDEFRDEYHDAAGIPVTSAKFLCVLGYPCSSIVYNTKSLAGQELLGHASVTASRGVSRFLFLPRAGLHLLHSQRSHNATAVLSAAEEELPASASGAGFETSEDLSVTHCQSCGSGDWIRKHLIQQHECDGEAGLGNLCQLGQKDHDD